MIFTFLMRANLVQSKKILNQICVWHDSGVGFFYYFALLQWINELRLSLYDETINETNFVVSETIIYWGKGWFWLVII